MSGSVSGDRGVRQPVNRPASQREAAAASCAALRLWPFLTWLATFYAVWLALMIVGDHWSAFRSHWGIAAVMVFGSYVAGSTPLGGGTVGFPALVLMLQQPASLGRDFGFAIQSIGMTSASILILCRRQPLEWTLLRWAMVGTVLGLPAGILVVAPNVSEAATKILFAIVWASFGILHLRRGDEICAGPPRARNVRIPERSVGLAIGLLCGVTVAAITGAGADMVLYATLVLVVRADLRTAVASSVVLMAFTSVVAVAVKDSLRPCSRACSSRGSPPRLSWPAERLWARSRPRG